MGSYQNFRGNIFYQFLISPLAGKDILGAQLELAPASTNASYTVGTGLNLAVTGAADVAGYVYWETPKASSPPRSWSP